MELCAVATLLMCLVLSVFFLCVPRPANQPRKSFQWGEVETNHLLQDGVKGGRSRQGSGGSRSDTSGRVRTVDPGAIKRGWALPPEPLLAVLSALTRFAVVTIRACCQ
jgi:hypothetical protein